MNRIDQLYRAVIAERGADAGKTRTARLFARGPAQIGKKLSEEAVEVIVAYMRGDYEATVQESVDVLYHHAVLWAELGINPTDVWNEMDRRTALTGLAASCRKTAPTARRRRSPHNMGAALAAPIEHRQFAKRRNIMRLMLCGGRHFEDVQVIQQELARLHTQRPIAVLIHGSASGLGAAAEAWARRNDIHIVRYPPNWELHGKKAESMRNAFMIKDSRPDLVMAFPGGRHTADLVRRAGAANIMVVSAALAETGPEDESEGDSIEGQWAFFLPANARNCFSADATDPGHKTAAYPSIRGIPGKGPRVGFRPAVRFRQRLRRKVKIYISLSAAMELWHSVEEGRKQ